MGAAPAATTVVLLHLLFVAFVCAGGLLVLRWPRVAWAHLPAVAWGVWIELSGWICPLTPLENAFRAQAGLDKYDQDFIARYLLPVLYPEGLTRETQVVLGLAVLALNVIVYAMAWRRLRRR